MHLTSFIPSPPSLDSSQPGTGKSPSSMTPPPSSQSVVSRPPMQMPPRGTGIQVR